ncbi:HPP family protein [Desulfovibrio cuneatus]|uniref:HPP family protein n=1 Tax=Desulfovibrio cuneatus TaxID=159728 RepID=UPI000421DF2B|nr:HPP family protein [Desulfovibrio cuneatus]
MPLQARKPLKTIATQGKSLMVQLPESFLRALAARKKVRPYLCLLGIYGKKNSMAAHVVRVIALRIAVYIMKMRGQRVERGGFSLQDVGWSFVGALLGMLALAEVNIAMWGRTEQGLVIGSMGASAMLVFSAPGVPFAQPRNVIAGHIVSALMGVLAQFLLAGSPWLASALAVALAVAAMQMTATQHPPAAASALIAVVGSPELKALGWLYAFYPVGISVAVLVVVGVVVNNMSRRRVYPKNWW